MKYLFLILLLFSGFFSKAQSNPSGFPTQSNMGWTKWSWVQSDSGFMLSNRIPNFTPRFPGTVILYQHAGVDSNLNFWNGARWIDLIPGFDSTSLSNRINLKLNITDTTNKWWSNTKRFQDTMYRINDSTIGFTINDGPEQTIQILGRASGGGGGGSGTVTSVALSMPSAFSVSGSPITSSGTFAVSGAGTTSQYIRGNGTLATFDTTAIPTFSAKVRSLFSGTSPITYNQSSGLFGIQNANTTGTKGAATFSNSDFIDNGSGLISLRNPSGTPGVDTITRTPGIDSIYFTINGTTYAIKDSTGVASSGITSLNGLTATTQTFATGTSGSDFNISSNTSTHTFNLPTASASNRGALSSSDWTTFNNKLSNITGLITAGTNISLTGSGTSGSPYVINSTASGLSDVLKVNDSVFVNSYSSGNFRFRDSVRWGILPETITNSSPANVRNDANSVIRLSNGRLICAYTSFGSNSGDADSAIIVTKYSDDAGVTWVGLDTAVGVAANGNYIPSLFLNPAGDTLRMLYLRANSTTTNQIYGTYTTNFTSNNPTWSAPAFVFGSGSQYYSPATDRVLVLKNGTYLYALPVHIDGELASGAGRYDGYLMKSLNGGATWDTVPGVRVISPDTLFVETGLTQTDDPFSLVQMYGRTRSGQVYMAQSTDSSASAFGAIYPWGLYANNSTTTIKYLEEYKLFVAATNRYLGPGTVNGVGGRGLLDFLVKKIPLPNINLAIAPDGFAGQWQFMYRVDSVTNMQSIEPSITFNDNELLITFSRGNVPAGDTFSLKTKKIPYYLLTATANQYAQQIILNKTFIGTDANFIEMYPNNGFSPTAAYFKIGNQTSGSSTNFGVWFQAKAAGSIAANPLLMTLTGNCFDGALWIDANNNGADINNAARILRLTNNGSSSTDERFGVYGDGSIRLSNSSGEYARWFGSTGNLAINTGGTDNGQKLQVDGAVRFDHVQAPPSTFKVLVHGLTDSVVYQAAIGNLLEGTAGTLQFDDAYMAASANNWIWLKSRMFRQNYDVPDANFTTLTTRQEAFFQLGDITANRTFDMSTGSGVTGQEIYVYNGNTTGNTWSFSGNAPHKSSDGSTVTTMTNGVLYHMLGTYVNSTAVWIIINQ